MITDEVGAEIIGVFMRGNLLGLLIAMATAISIFNLLFLRRFDRNRALARSAIDAAANMRCGFIDRLWDDVPNHIDWYGPLRRSEVAIEEARKLFGQKQYVQAIQKAREAQRILQSAEGSLPSTNLTDGP
jgi:hypothetical protein